MVGFERARRLIGQVTGLTGRAAVTDIETSKSPGRTEGCRKRVRCESEGVWRGSKRVTAGASGNKGREIQSVFAIYQTAK